MQVSLSLQLGRLTIPRALRQGFMQPIIEWLEGQRDREQGSSVKHKVFDNVETWAEWNIFWLF